MVKKLLSFFIVIEILSFAGAAICANPNSKPVEIQITVTDKGFQPPSIKVPSGRFVTLKITRKSDETCATAVLIPSLKIKKYLPLNKMVTLALGRLEKGEIKMGCPMEMMESSIIHVE